MLSALCVLLLYFEVANFELELWERASCTTVVQFCSRSSGNALRVLLLRFKLASIQPELRTCTSRTTFVDRSCEFRAGAAGARFSRYLRCDCAAGAAGVLFVYYFCTQQLRFCSLRECSLHTTFVSQKLLKITIFNPERQCSSRSPACVLETEISAGAAGMNFTLVLENCYSWAGAGADKGKIEPATPRLRKQARKPRHNFQRPFASSESEKIRTVPQRERFDTHDLRRRFAALKPNSHGATARALQHARSPCESSSTRTISAEASARPRQLRTAPQRERFDTRDLRRGVRFVSFRRAYPRQKKKKNQEWRSEGSKEKLVCVFRILT